MAGFKETPRQKMIGMLYLVLMALLALNVSVEVLDAFVTVNESMEATNENFARKIEATYISFEQQNQLNPARVGPFYETAQEVRDISNELIDYLSEMIIASIAYSERIEIEEARNYHCVMPKPKISTTGQLLSILMKEGQPRLKSI
jgi:gliding motility-associated protein GldM